jgi:hypothetical protein
VRDDWGGLRRIGVIFAPVLVLLAGAPVAHAAQVTLSFDDKANGTAITNQYQAAAQVEFGKFTGGATGSPFSIEASSPASLANSAPNVLLLGQCSGAGKEFPHCTTDNYIRFNVPQSTISFRMGFDSTAAFSHVVQVTAYDASGTQITSVSPTVGVGVHTPVTITQPGSGAAAIVYLHFTHNDFDNAYEYTAIDDLSFDNGSAPASPQIGVAASGEAFLYTGNSAATTTETLTVGRFAGSTGPVTLAVAGLPPGVSAKIAANPFTGGDGGTDVVTLSAPGGTAGQPLKTITVTATPSASAGSQPVTVKFPVHVLNTYSTTTLGISLAQAAGDPAQTGPSGSSLAYNGVPLVAGRSTLVRLFADPVGLILPGTSGLTAQLFGSVNGKALPGSPLSADAGGPPSLADETFSTQLGKAATAFHFVLPASWTTAGPISLAADVNGPGNLLNISPDPTPNATVSCSNCPQSSPSLSLSLTGVHFTDMPTFVVTPVQMVWLDAKTAKLRTAGDPQKALAPAYETAPVGKIKALGYVDTLDITALQFDEGGVGGDQADTDAQNLLVQWAQTKFQNDGNKNTFGSMLMAFNDALARGMSNSNTLLGNDSQGHAVYEPVSTVAVNRQISSVAHEMGHNFGRLHADQTCGGPAGGGSDGSWPDPNGYIEPTSDQANGPGSPTPTAAFRPSYGVDLLNRVQGFGAASPFVIYPSSSTYDLMSYCAGVPDFNSPPSAGFPGSDWTSPRGWEQAFTCVQPSPPASCPPTQFHPAAAAADRASAAAAAGPALHGPTISFLGYLAPGGQLISPALMPASGGVAGAKSSPYKAQLLDASGKVISSEPLGGTPTHIELGQGHHGVPLVLLQGFLPTHGKTVAGLAVSASGHVVKRIAAPRHVPRVKVRKPSLRAGATTLALRWRTTDPDRGRRTAFVAIATGRSRFTTIWAGFDRGTASIPTINLRSGRIRLRVTVTDGFHGGVGYVTFTVPKAVVKHGRRAGAPAWEQALARIGISVRG